MNHEAKIETIYREMKKVTGAEAEQTRIQLRSSLAKGRQTRVSQVKPGNGRRGT